MSIDLPQNTREIYLQIITDIANNIPELNPQLKNSLINALTAAYTEGAYQLYHPIAKVILEGFPDTATAIYLERWGSIFGIDRNAATPSTGDVLFTGTVGGIIPLATSITGGGSNTYTTTTSGTIANNSFSVSTLTRIGDVVTVTISAGHTFATGMNVTIAGAVEPEYNGSYVIKVTGDFTFTYRILTTPSSPATGTITADADYTIVTVNSDGFGANQNLLSGDTVSLGSPIAGVDNTGYVMPDEIGGGADIETDDSLRNRLLLRLRNYFGNFSKSTIEEKVLSVSGNTRVWVIVADELNFNESITTLTRSGSVATATTATPHGLHSGEYVTISGANEPEYNIGNKILVLDSTNFQYVITGTPASPATGTITAQYNISGLGYIRVYFVRDNDGDGIAIIPTQSEVDTTKTALLEIMPPDMSLQNMIVEAPVAVVIPVTFTSLNPNTPEMQTAIVENLKEAFAANVNLGQDVEIALIESTIYTTTDISGNRVISFNLSVPVGTTTINFNEIGILGTVTF